MVIGPSGLYGLVKVKLSLIPLCFAYRRVGIKNERNGIHRSSILAREYCTFTHATLWKLLFLAVPPYPIVP